MKLPRLRDENKTEILFARIQPSQNVQLQSLADEYGLNRSQLVRTAIQEFLVRHA